MARGWESKSVEDQVAERQDGAESAPNRARQASMARAEQQRRHQDLELQRERILDQRTSNPHRRAALAAALADIEEQLDKLK
ncbi:MAG TPA: hypothetical protein VE178_17465 [Silvibacterium sp.]|jgi:arginase family enzyme|nr:hypothetical protein [Silvibacterium sp.]